jgi:DNA processing protein
MNAPALRPSGDAPRRERPADLLGCLNATSQKNAPEWLYVAGDTDLLGLVPRVAMVGTRKPSRDGCRRAERLARELVQRDVVVVSGLARGVDTVAHQTALDTGGRTIAVLGTPLDVAYPRENAALQARIMAEHLVLTQFGPGHPVGRSNFPRRNRTMALLTHATVIVEAGEGSGTLSQGWEALRLGRSLFILNSLAETPGLAWPAEMVKYGAQVLTDVDQLIEVLPPRLDGSLAELAF